MIIKLTTTGRNEIVYVNFDYVRMMRSIDTFTELVMSDDKYHKITVTESPREIYEMLYPPVPCVVDGTNQNTENEASKPDAAAAETKKATTKKTTAKAAETN
jgi:hypothetical protein